MRRLVLLAGLAACGALSSAQGRNGPSQTSVVLSELIDDHPSYPQCHASTLVETASGQLLAAWFGGSHERHPDVGIWVSRREADRWLEPREVANGVEPDGPRFPTWNPVLFQPRDGPLFLFYKVGPSPSEWWGEVVTSPDEGRTWGLPRRLPEGILGPIKNKPVTLADGSWLAPSSTESPTGGWRIHFERTGDGGATWQSTGAVAGPGFDAIQPSLLLHPGGKLQALCRTRQGAIASTWSEDGGRTWSPLAATRLPNPNSGIDAVTLRDGRQLLVYNHSAPPPGSFGGGARYPLDVAVSRDGVEWERILTLESDPRPAGYAYPAVIQTRDGKVHVTYTWDRRRIKHVVIDPELLLANQDRHEPGWNGLVPERVE